MVQGARHRLPSTRPLDIEETSLSPRPLSARSLGHVRLSDSRSPADSNGESATSGLALPPVVGSGLFVKEGITSPLASPSRYGILQHGPDAPQRHLAAATAAAAAAESATHAAAAAAAVAAAEAVYAKVAWPGRSSTSAHAAAESLVTSDSIALFDRRSADPPTRSLASPRAPPERQRRVFNLRNPSPKASPRGLPLLTSDLPGPGSERHTQLSQTSAIAEAAAKAREAAAAAGVGVVEVQAELDALLDDALFATASAKTSEPRLFFATAAARIAGVQPKPSVHLPRSDASVQCYLSEDWSISSLTDHGDTRQWQPGTWMAANVAPDPRQVETTRNAVASLIEQALRATVVDFPLVSTNGPAARRRLAAHLLFANGLPWPDGVAMDASMQADIAARHNDPMARALRHLVDRERARAFGFWSASARRLSIMNQAFNRALSRNLALGHSTWRCYAQEVGLSQLRMRMALVTLVKHQLAVGMSAWRQQIGAKATKAQRVRRMILHHVSRSWSRWLKHVAKCMQQLQTLHMFDPKRRSLRYLWEVWKCFMAEHAEHIRVLRIAHPATREQSRAFRAWRVAFQERVELTQLLRKAVASFMHDKLNRGIRTWRKTLSRAGLNRMLGRAMSWYLNRSLALAWSSWDDYATEHREQLRILNKANPATVHLARGWASWCECRDQLLLLRRANPAAVKVARAWSAWQSTVLPRDQKHMMQRAMRKCLKQTLQRGWQGWLAMVQKRLEQLSMLQ